MRETLEKVQAVGEKATLSRKWTVGGIVLLLAAFFMHPDQCVTATSLVGNFVTTENAPHIAALIGTILTILGKGLFQRD